MKGKDTETQSLRNTLPPRLKSRVLIDELFQSRDSKVVTAFPIRATYRDVEAAGSDAPLQVMFTVSKRHFKHAVDRNRIKRQMREGLRLNKSLLDGTPRHIAFVWMTNQHFSSQRVGKAMVKVLHRIAGEQRQKEQSC